jgi:hypothetical protein
MRRRLIRPTARSTRRAMSAVLAGLLCAAAGASGMAGAATTRTRRPAARAPRLSRAQVLARLDASRAVASYQVMQRTYYLSSIGRYRGAFAWPYSQAMGATISVASLPGMHRPLRYDLIARLNGLAAYADHADPPPGGYFAYAHSNSTSSTRFNDDNEWIGIELLRLYHLDHQKALVAAAGNLMALVWSQWQGSSATCPGGVPWERIEANGDRNTVSNATGAELGAQLYLYTGQQSYLDEAVQMYNWVRHCLLTPDGLYADHLSGDGSLDPTEWTYNQGEMIGAGVMLFKATGNGGYLDQAQATAKTALAAFGPAQLADQATTFNAIYIRNLLLLGGVSGDPQYARFAQWYADDAWANVRDPDTGLFRAGPGGTTQLLDQASMAQLYALLAEPPSLT